MLLHNSFLGWILIGLVAGIELAPIAGKPGARAFDARSTRRRS